MHSPHAMYASVVCERHRALRVAAEAQVLPWVCRADDHAGLSGTVRVVVPSCTARQSAPCHSSSRVPVWMSRPLVACGGGVLLVIGAVVAVHTIIEPLYHVSSAASPYSPMWRIMDPLAANALFYGFLCVGILCFWNWFNLLRPAFTAVGTDTSDVVWGCINAALPLVAGTLGLTLLRGDT